MGQSLSSSRGKSGRRSFKRFTRRNKFNSSNLSHTFNMLPSEEHLELMNVNTATEEQLMTLPGVNRQLAEAIVLHRQMIGRFKRIDDLALVSGVGAEKLDLLRPDICVSSRKAVSRTSSCTQSLDSVRTNGESRLCSVNTASVFQLQCIPGLNQEIAANIVDYRNENGPFKSLDDLIKVRGMNIVRLSTVKSFLSVEFRKFGSFQQLGNEWTDSSLNSSTPNGMSTPVSSHKKSFAESSKFTLTLPNGFATAPVNDILDLLSAYSHRPVVEEEFIYERKGIKCYRVASWNLHQLTVDKIINPGVREVICRTILENKFSIIAVQDVTEEAALKLICEELNSPNLKRVREWKSNNYRWNYCLSIESIASRRVGFIFETYNSGIMVEDVGLEEVLISEESRKLIRELTRLPCNRYLALSQAFLICQKPLILVNVQCEYELTDEDRARWQRMVDEAVGAGVEVVLLGEFRTWSNINSLENFHSLLNEDECTKADASVSGQCAILCRTPIEKTNYNGHSGIVRSGLTHLAIPRGWSWGGPASPFCPIWAELTIPD